MRLRFADFAGEIPRRHPRLLPQSYAQVARNTRLDDGAITTFRVATQAHNFGMTIRRVVRFGGQWVGWSSADVAAVPGPIADNRLYITGEGQPKMRVGSTTYNLALPGPTQRPTIALIGDPDDDPEEERVVYAYTFRTEFFEESAPSPLSLPRTWRSGQIVRVSSFATGALNRGISHIRIYRSQTSALGTTDLYFVREVALGTGQFDHDIETDPLQEVIQTTDYDTPVAGLQGVIAMPNGMMAAFAGREVFFSEPYRPHAWPRKYALTVDHPVVGLVAFGPVLAILTQSTPYIAQGNSPEVMIMEKMEQNLPCLARHGIVDLGYAAAYPSHEGLVLISATGAQVVSRTLFTREQWRIMQPATFRAAQHDGRYLVSYQPIGAGTRKTGLIDLSGEQPFFIEATGDAISWYAEPGTGTLFYIPSPGTAGTVMQWDAPGAAPQKQRWRGRLNVLPMLTNFGAALVDAEQAPANKPAGEPDATVRVFADGALVRQFTTLNQPVRLPSGFAATQWEVEVEGYAPITGISIATSIDQLAEP